MFSFPRLPARRSTLIATVLVALVLAQWLGITHRVAHAHESASHAAVAGEHEAEHGFEALFGHDRGSACDLYDQLTHADALPGVPASVLPVVAPMPVVVVHRAWHLAAQSTGFLARGPPSLS